MSAPPPIRAFYLQGEAEPIFALFHAPAEDARREGAVLICPPFGWEDVCSYRSRREWAERLASAGFSVLRIDLPGTGDSGGSPRDPHRLLAWTEAVRTATDWLAGTVEDGHVAAVGIGLGGLVLCNAIGAGAPIEELVLWGVPSRGRAFVRELRAFERMEAARGSTDRSLIDPPGEGETRAGGYVLSAETTRALEELDLASLDLFPGRLTRALLLERDGMRVDPRLHEHLEQVGTAVELAPGEGYGAMMAEPPEGRAPLMVFDRVQEWLEEAHPVRGRGQAPALEDGRPARAEGSARRSHGASGADGGAPRDPRASGVLERDTAELIVAGRPIRETPMAVEQSFGALFGVLAEPREGAKDGLCAVILNAGATRHTGPNRMWVEAARRWAARGVSTLRLDVEGIGDSDGDYERLTELAELYVPGLVDQTLGAIDELQRRGVGERFVCVGLCSGAYWSFHAALRDERVVGALMLNPQALSWDASLEPIRKLRRALLHRSSWHRLLHGEVTPAQMRPVVAQAPHALVGSARRRLERRRAKYTDGDEVQHAFEELERMDKYLLLAFSGEEPLRYELDHEGRLEILERSPNVELTAVPGEDHTLRPPASQRSAHQALDQGLERVLDREERRTPTGALN